jgi:nitroreductase
MNIFDVIMTRRSVREFTDRPIERATIEQLLTAAAAAPNHRMTQPWRFYVLGPVARRAYGAALGARKAKKVDDPVAARAILDKVAAANEKLPAMIIFAMVQDAAAEAADPSLAEENYGAMMMAVQNFALAATGAGLATHIKTGAIMQDPAARAAAGVAGGEKIVAVVELGEPAALPSPKPRTVADQLTTWRD